MQKEKLQQFALYAEIISSVAVLATLIFLAVELRENTEVAKSSAYSRSMSELNSFRLALNSNELLLPIWEKYLDQEFDDLSRSEGIRMSGIIGAMFGIYEDAYYSHAYGIMGDSEWTRFESRVCENYARIDGSSYIDFLSRAVSEEFYLHVVSRCQ